MNTSCAISSLAVELGRVWHGDVAAVSPFLDASVFGFFLWGAGGGQG